MVYMLYIVCMVEKQYEDNTDEVAPSMLSSWAEALRGAICGGSRALQAPWAHGPPWGPWAQVPFKPFKTLWDHGRKCLLGPLRPYGPLTSFKAQWAP
jgi:hypothetical protein